MHTPSFVIYSYEFFYPWTSKPILLKLTTSCFTFLSPIYVSPRFHSVILSCKNLWEFTRVLMLISLNAPWVFGDGPWKVTSHFWYNYVVLQWLFCSKSQQLERMQTEAQFSKIYQVPYNALNALVFLLQKIYPKVITWNTNQDLCTKMTTKV